MAVLRERAGTGRPGVRRRRVLLMARVVDANVHVIAADRVAYPISPRRGNLPAWAVGSTEELLEHMRIARVDQAVLVHSAAIYGDDPRYTLDSAARFQDRCVALVGVDAGDDNAVQTLRRLMDAQRLHGIRLERRDRTPAAAWLH